MERTKQSNEKYALEIFSSQAYLTVNKRLLKHYGPDVAIFLSNLVDKYKYFADKNMLIDNIWFFLLHEQQTEQTGLTITKIRTCKTLLKEDNILETKLIGIPAKEHYKLNLDLLLDKIQLSAVRASHQDSLGQAIRTGEGYIRSSNNNKENKEEKRKEKNIIPPKIELIVKYCQERNSSVNPNIFYDWNTSKGWIIGKEKMKDWQAAIRTWEQRDKQQNKSTNKSGSRFGGARSSGFRKADKIVN